MEELARQVADGRATHSEGLDALVQTYIRDVAISACSRR